MKDDDESLAPIFCRPGAKRPIADKIIDRIPDHRTYVEPFVGGGSIFLRKPLSEKNVINDLDKDLMKGYRLIKELGKGGPELSKFPFKNTIATIQALVNKPYRDKYEDLLAILYMSCNTFSSTGRGKIYSAYTGESKIKKLEKYANKLKNTTILSEDYIKVLRRYDSPTTFFFLDPPYEASDKMYKDDSIDYAVMNEELKKLKGNFLLTINDSPHIRRAFKGFNIKALEVRSFWKSTTKENPGGKVKAPRKELFISNYTL